MIFFNHFDIFFEYDIELHERHGSHTQHRYDKNKKKKKFKGKNEIFAT